jgi:hypothetical protein
MSALAPLTGGEYDPTKTQSGGEVALRLPNVGGYVTSVRVLQTIQGVA